MQEGGQEPRPPRQTPRRASKVMLMLPLIALVVLLLTYFGLFSSPVVIVFVLALYIAVSLLNRRKFARQRQA